jgi:hypothetical protein
MVTLRCLAFTEIPDVLKCMRSCSFINEMTPYKNIKFDLNQENSVPEQVHICRQQKKENPICFVYSVKFLKCGE